MVFMEDSERAATVARNHGTDAGLHINFTSSFTAPGCSTRLQEHQNRVAAYLLRHRLAQAIFHPGLVQSFEYVFAAQIDEYRRLYGADPARLDGHHHMHLSANVVGSELMPEGTLVRRNFSFRPGEKSIINRVYRRSIDRKLARRHHLVDYLFSLPPLEPMDRLRRVFDLARQSVVELETHPVNQDEYLFLTGGGILQELGEVPIAPCFPKAGSAAGGAHN